MATKVIDVSKYQANINYKETAKVISGAILRCGITYWGKQDKDKDPLFETHYKGFKAAGVPVGVYYYSAADSVAQAKLEAQKCLEIIKGKQLEFPVYFDMENNERQGKLTGAQKADIAEAFLSTVEAAGYFVGFYSYSAWIYGMGSAYDRIKNKYSIWLADYRSTPANYAKDMWQYTGSGKIAGISGNVDLNWCYKDFPSIIKKAGLNGFSKAQAQAKPDNSFDVVVTCTSLYIRGGAGTTHPIRGVVRNGQVLKITEVKGNWGKLKSGEGWINISSKYCKKV